MKKRNIFKKAALSFVVASLFFSCKSTPDTASVDPFELLDGDAALYLTIPVQANKEFFSEAIQKVSGAAESDAQKLADRLEMAFVAIGMNGEMQLSVNGKIPTTMAGFALTEKKGWKSGAMERQVVYTHGQTLYQLCMPSSANAFLSHNIEPMVKRYNKIAYASLPETERTESDDDSSVRVLSETLDAKSYSFLHDNISSDIVLYSPLPKAFLRSFLGGAEVTTPIESVSAILSQDRGVLEEFNVKLTLTMSDPRTVKAATAILKTALFGVPAKISQTGEKQITIVDLPVSRKRMLSLIR